MEIDETAVRRLFEDANDAKRAEAEAYRLCACLALVDQDDVCPKPSSRRILR
jgi:hypothetical protein